MSVGEKANEEEKKLKHFNKTQYSCESNPSTYFHHKNRMLLWNHVDLPDIGHGLNCNGCHVPMGCITSVKPLLS
jgi:hypothetical protein